MPDRKVFQQAQTPDIQHSAFDLSHEVRTTGKMGNLIPCYISEILPNDEFQVNTRHVIRMAPMLYPLFHKVDVYFHYFFVPNRILWDEWENFITGGEQGNESPTFPTEALENIDNLADRARLSDYLGLPITEQGDAGTSDIEVSLLPFRAYAKIYNDYYRDQNQTDEIDLTTSSVFDLRKRAWQKDYFTSALPWTQRATSRIEIPGDASYTTDPDTLFKFDQDPGTGDSITTFAGGSGDYQSLGADGTPAAEIIYVENIDEINIDIADLRRSLAIQKWLELSARTGSRYTEHLASNWNVRHSDQALQRAEYLGGGRESLNISEVLATAEGTNTDVGYFTGHGISSGNRAGFRRKFEEHGYVIGIMSVLPETGYHQGIPRHWSRTDKFDYYHPLFAHIGEQAIKNKELYFDPTDDDWNDEDFAYQQRFAEYKYEMNRSHAEFRDENALAAWHLDRIFTSQPSLSEEFIEADPDTRIFNIDDTDADHLWCYLAHNVQARRPMPYFSNPGL